MEKCYRHQEFVKRKVNFCGNCGESLSSTNEETPDVTALREDFEGSRNARKRASYIGAVGVVALAYVGLRALFGAEVNYNEPHTLMQWVDGISANLGMVGLLALASSPLYWLYEREQKKILEEEREKTNRQGKF